MPRIECGLENCKHCGGKGICLKDNIELSVAMKTLGWVRCDSYEKDEEEKGG